MLVPSLFPRSSEFTIYFTFPISDKNIKYVPKRGRLWKSLRKKHRAVLFGRATRKGELRFCHCWLSVPACCLGLPTCVECLPFMQLFKLYSIISPQSSGIRLQSLQVASCIACWTLEHKYFCFMVLCQLFCCIANNPQLSALKWQPFVISYSHWVSWVGPRRVQLELPHVTALF